MSQYDKVWGKHRADAEFCKHDRLVSNFPETPDQCPKCDWCSACRNLFDIECAVSKYDGDTCTECFRMWGYDYHPDDCRACHGDPPPSAARIHRYDPRGT
ncbi:hypothetical protein GCM10028801_31300 [Nocardioides maradonensis]